MADQTLCPECAQGKCINCTGWTLNINDELDVCDHVEGEMHI
jgi:hypothetical protein